MHYVVVPYSQLRVVAKLCGGMIIVYLDTAWSVVVQVFLPSNERFWMVASYSTIYLYGQASNIIGKSEGIVEASVS